MKTYDELTVQQQEKAVEKATLHIVTMICEGVLQFNDEANGDDFQSRINAAFAKAEKMHTPWFAHEYLMEDEVVKSNITGMAQCDAEDALYAEPSDPEVIYGIID